MYRSRKNYESAISHYSKAVKLAETHDDPNHYILESYPVNLARTYYNVDQPEEALAVYQRRLEVTLDAHPSDEVRIASSKHDIVRAFLEVGDYSQAESMMNEVLTQLEYHMKPTDLQLSLAHQTLGQIYAKQQRFDDAVAEFDTAIQIAILDEHNPHLPPMFLEDKAKMYEEAGLLEAARAAQQKADDLRETRSRTPNPKP